MSVTTNGRAMVFVSEPQDVEVHRGEDWVLGAMLGWRHEHDGSCRALVRVTEGRIEKTAWADLEHVRLPEQHDVTPAHPQTILLTVAAERAGGAEWTGVHGPSAGPAPRREHAVPRPEEWSPGSATVGGVVPERTGRHRAPSEVAHDGFSADPEPGLSSWDLDETARWRTLRAQLLAELGQTSSSSDWDSSEAAPWRPARQDLTRPLTTQPLTLPAPPQRRSDDRYGSFTRRLSA